MQTLKLARIVPSYQHAIVVLLEIQKSIFVTPPYVMKYKKKELKHEIVYESTKILR